jgi:hypothetical protein
VVIDWCKVTLLQALDHMVLAKHLSSTAATATATAAACSPVNILRRLLPTNDQPPHLLQPTPLPAALVAGLAGKFARLPIGLRNTAAQHPAIAGGPDALQISFAAAAAAVTESVHTPSSHFTCR